jgi:hypothetical protein
MGQHGTQNIRLGLYLTGLSVGHFAWLIVAGLTPPLRIGVADGSGCDLALGVAGSAASGCFPSWVPIRGEVVVEVEVVNADSNVRSGYCH